MSIAGARGLELRTSRPATFSILWDLNCFTESLLLPSLGFLGSPSRFPIRGRISTQLSWFRSSLCLPSANSRQGPKHDLVRSSGSSLCHDACGALESWKARQPHLRPTTTRQQGHHPALHGSIAESSRCREFDLDGRPQLPDLPSLCTCFQHCWQRVLLPCCSSALFCSFPFDICILSRRYRDHICIHHPAQQSSIRKRRTTTFPPLLGIDHIDAQPALSDSIASERDTRKFYPLLLNELFRHSPMDRRGR